MLNSTLLTSSVLGLVGLMAVLDRPAAEPTGPIGTVSNALEQTGSRAYLHSFNLPGHGVALEGFSPVSYFEGTAERGSALFAVEHAGVTYHLTSARQVATFQANPERFVPAFGGWCAFGMAVSDKFPVDPTNFEIVDERLFLFLRNPAVDALELWNQGDEQELLQKAEAHWTKVQG